MIRISNAAAKCFCLVFLVCFSKSRNNQVLSFLLVPLEKCQRAMMRNHNNPNTKLCMSSTKKQEKPPQTTTDQEIDDETPLNPVGAQFFGGSAEKEELFDEDIEKNSANASTLVLLATFNRFDNLDAFPDATAKSVARKLQTSLNALLHPQQDESSSSEGTDMEDIIYSSDFTWISPLKLSNEARTPFEEIAIAKDFYRRMDISIISAKSSTSTTNKIELRWMISLVWPNFWEAQVTITGTSLLTMNGFQITNQEDFLDYGDTTNAIAWQLLPRFWDMFHIGMTPSAELQPRLPVSQHKHKFFSNYQIYDIPPRYVLKPSILDTGSRDMRLAQVLPSSAFSCFIVTAGKFKQRYVPISFSNYFLFIYLYYNIFNFFSPIFVSLSLSLSFLRYFGTLDALQFFLLPFVLGKSMFALILSNTLYAVAFSCYFYITHLGYRALPFLTNTEVFLFPIVAVVLLYVLNFVGHPFGLGFNASRLMAHLFFD